MKVVIPGWRPYAEGERNDAERNVLILTTEQVHKTILPLPLLLKHERMVEMQVLPVSTLGYESHGPNT